jgi:two-component system, OmpR family, sensor histidine kinase CpxA
MRTLFARIFLWFWITGTLSLVASVSVIVLQRHAMRPSSPLVLQDTSRFFGTAVADVFEESGARSASEYVRELSKNTGIEGCILNERAEPLVGEACDGFRAVAIVASLGKGPETSVSEDGTQVALKVRSASGRNYILVAKSVTGLGLSPTYDWGTLLLRGLSAIVVSGLICYYLARYLTKPIQRLRTATRRIAAGQLDTRIEEGVPRNGDELGGLARDFNSMADQIQQLLTSQRQLLYDISHELRSPLARINVALDTLRTRLHQEPLLGRIEGDLQQLNEMIGRILTVAKLETTAALPSTHPVELVPLLESIASDADFEARENGSSVELAETSEATVNGDPNLLRSAIENVVRNAVRFTSPGSCVEMRVKVTNSGERFRALVRIRDHGPGVPEEELGNIFKAFYRVTDTGSRNTRGVGLGLSITDKIIRLHGGTISASNVENGGLLVEIELPAITPEVRSASAMTETLAAGQE